MKNFALIGAAGYIAPRHMKAIKETGNNLLVAYDISDSVGIIDSFFPKSYFFNDFNEFKDFIKKNKKEIDFLSICTPNFLHSKFIEIGLKMGFDVICEKPLVKNTKIIKNLEELELSTGKKTFSILQLRHHPVIKNLKKEIDNFSKKKYNVELTYITGRGPWYNKSWKNNTKKSFGIVANIGIHFFDILYFLFGKNIKNFVNLHNKKSASGYLEFEKANVKWFLSIDENYLPSDSQLEIRTHRSMKISGKSINFTEGFTELHTESYKNILKGNGFRLDQALPSIEIVENIKKQKVLVKNSNNIHPLCKK